MKFSIIFLVLVFIWQPINTYAQKTNISLNLSNEPIKNILKEIEYQSNYTFLYNDAKIDVTKRISINVKNKNINIVLKAILKNTDISYLIIDQQVILVEKEKIEKFAIRSANDRFKITGKITDNNNEALFGVFINIKGTSIGTSTDSDGNYVLLLDNPEAKIVFSFIGYKKEEIQVYGDTTINIALKEQEEQIEQVVVVGYGVQAKSDLTGSISSMRGSNLAKIPSASAEQMLQGKAAGVHILNSGAPGTTPVIRIRGVGTLNNSSPIFVVDGVVTDDISFLNSFDIESIEILKDASSTAIYGSRGANGVIIITTKNGNSSKGQEIIVSSEYSLQYLPKKIDMLSGYQFAKVVNEINPGTFNNISKVKNTNWQEEIFKEIAPIYNLQLSFAGSGSNKYKYYISTGYFNQEGIIPKSAYQRLSFKFNQNIEFKHYFIIGTNLSASQDKRDIAAAVVPQAYRAWPTSVPYNPDGSFANVRGAGNPLASIAFNNSYYGRRRAIGSFFMEFRFLKSFVFKSSYGFDLNYGKGKSFIPAYQISPTSQNLTNDLSVTTNETNTWQWENTLTYSKSVKNHKINTLAGYTTQYFKQEVLGGAVQNLLGDDPSLWYLNAGETATQLNTNYGSISTMISYLFRLNYAFKEKYLLTFSFRSDGSSKFNKQNRYGYFPSFAAGWVISKENFLKNIQSVSNLKLRASWGKIGNEKINQNSRFHLVRNELNTVFGSTEYLVAGASLGNIANPNIIWEITTQLDIGLEIELLNGLIRGEFDFFKRNTDDILVGVTAPGHLGNGFFVKTVTNAASVLNKGFEFNVGIHKNFKDFRFGLSTNGVFIDNKVLKLAASTGNDSYILGGNIRNGQLVTRTEVGLPIGAFYGYNVIGVFQNLADLEANPSLDGQEIGDLKFEDINGDGIIDNSDRGFIGSAIPNFIYGFSTNIYYKNFSFLFDFQGQKGNKLYNGKNAVRPNIFNFESRLENRWTGEGSSNTEPRATAGGLNYLPSNYFIEDGSFLKLRSATLSYNLREKLISRMNIYSVEFFLKATNLRLFSKFSGYSPEISIQNVLSSGIDMGNYPVTSIASVGFKIIL